MQIAGTRTRAFAVMKLALNDRKIGVGLPAAQQERPCFELSVKYAFAFQLLSIMSSNEAKRVSFRIDFFLVCHDLQHYIF